jgi:hypothetical protein
MGDGLFVDESLLLKPERVWDDVDRAARAYYACPVCSAHRSSSCRWAARFVVPAWPTHAARRRLVLAEDLEAIRDPLRALRHRPRRP